MRRLLLLSLIFFASIVPAQPVTRGQGQSPLGRALADALYCRVGNSCVVTDFTITGTCTGCLTGAAPSTATFITQTADATLTNEQALSSLTTGIVKVTNGTGVLATAVAGDFPTLNQNTTGTAALATALQTPRTINGDSFDGTANIQNALASSDFANQGTTTTVLHGNAAGNPSFGAVSISDVTASTGTDNFVFSTSPNLTTPTITTRIEPTTDDGAPLGSTSKQWSDLFCATGCVLNFGNGNVTLTHAAGSMTYAAGQHIFTFSTAASSFERAFATDGNTVRELIQFRRSYSGGAGADGIGGKVAFYAETETEGTLENIGEVLFTTTDATAGTVDADFSVAGRLNGAQTNVFKYTGTGHAVFTGTAPSLASCGTGATVAGNDSVGRITVGTGGFTACVVTFAQAWGTAPVCTTFDETTGILIRPTATTTTLTLTGAAAASDLVVYMCAGY